MENFKGTKGKWKLEQTRYANCITIKNEEDQYIAMLSLNVVRPCLMKEQEVINEANAKLISCAPEMLEMLEKVSEINFNEEIQKEIKQLIKKATEL